MLSLKAIDAVLCAAVEDLKSRGADPGAVARVLMAYGANVALQVEGRPDAMLLALRLAEECRNGTGFVHVRRDGQGFASVPGRLDAATPTAGRG
jgi:hypothetical protein